MSYPGQPPRPVTLTGKPGSELQKTLMGNEVILAATQVGASALIATNFRAIIIKPSGLFGSLTSTYTYQQITSVDIRKQLLGGYIELSGGGVQNFRHRPTGQDIAQAPNTFPYGKLFGNKEQEVEHVVAVIRQQISIGHAPQAMYAQAAPVSQPLPGIPEQIQKLAALRDAGIISPAEFEAKKADLLSRM